MKTIKLLLTITIVISIISCTKQTDSTISIPVESIALDETELILTVGESVILKTTVTPENATFKMLIWSSDKETVATVTDSGIVTAVGNGIAIITVESSAGDKKAICKITVNEINHNEEDDITVPATPESPSESDDEKTEVFLIFNPIGGLWADGTSDIKSISGKADGKIVAPENPTKTGYSFDGWNNIIPEKFPAESVEYTAKWNLINYTITYDLGDGTNSDSNPNDYTIETETFVFANPTKLGYTFDGWYTDESFFTKITEIVKGTTENINLYAKWIKTNLGITAELPSDKLNIKHNVWISENYSVIEEHFTASEGFESYEWWADSEKQTAICEEFIFAAAGNVYGLKSAFSVGTHIITVIAKDSDGLYYSASYTLVVE